MEQQLPEINERYIELSNMMGAVAATDAGIGFLQYLCQISGFNRPIMSLEDAARRDVYLTVRQFLPVEKLPLIEHEQLRQKQQMISVMLDDYARALAQGEIINE